jgi:uncharacterized protein
MMLSKDVELINGLPIAYIRSIDSLVLSDLHLGYESHMAKRGIFIPKVNLKKIINELEIALKSTKAKNIVVVGDIKNEFSTVGADEFNELHELIGFCNEKKIGLVLIKGNHDNFIDRYKEPFKFKVYTNEALIGDYFFFHGDRLPAIPKKKPKMLISGHEHPTIGISNSAGRSERLRCFLFEKYKGIPYLVLPAINYFASGSDINVNGKWHLLSPALKRINIDNAHAIVIGYGSTIDFGTIGKLKKINQR